MMGRKTLGQVRAELEAVQEEAALVGAQEQAREDALTRQREELRRRRGGEADEAAARVRRNKVKGDVP